MGWLDGKIAIVTGAGGGIGRAHAMLMAAEGASVVVNDVGCDVDGRGRSDAAERVAGEIVAAGGRAVVNAERVGSFEGAERIVASALEAFGRLDILVNNAGILRDRTILKMSPEEWSEVIEVHLTGTFACLQAAARAMVEAGRGGRIINTSSSSGLLGNFGQANYGAAKIGVHALTRIAAMELARHRITVNALAPIAVTRMSSHLPEMAGNQDVERWGPQFISPVAAYLASDAAAGVTGQTFGVEGGRVFIYKMMTSHGHATTVADRPRTIQEVAEAMERIIFW
jgi:NAD(P)-dependent dehydrogenase (short-subunit alcohol dehydrogenase family)